MVTYHSGLHQRIIEYLGRDVSNTGVIDVSFGNIRGVALTDVEGFRPGKRANTLGVMVMPQKDPYWKDPYFYINEGSTISLQLDAAIICALARLNRDLRHRVHRHEYPGEDSTVDGVDYLKVKYYVFHDEGEFRDEQLGRIDDGGQLGSVIHAPLTTRTLEDDLAHRVRGMVDNMVRRAGVVDRVQRMIKRHGRDVPK